MPSEMAELFQLYRLLPDAIWFVPVSRTRRAYSRALISAMQTVFSIRLPRNSFVPVGIVNLFWNFIIATILISVSKFHNIFYPFIF